MLVLENIVITQDDFRLTADFAVATGARVAVIGPSGAGKSTLLSVISGFFPAASGRILWKGRDMSGLAPGERPLSILFQDQNLFPHLTVAQNVGLGLRPNLGYGGRDRPGGRGAGPHRPCGHGGPQARHAVGRPAKPRRAGPGPPAEPAADAAGRTLLRARPGPQGRDARPRLGHCLRNRRDGADGQPRSRRCPPVLPRNRRRRRRDAPHHRSQRRRFSTTRPRRSPPISAHEKGAPERSAFSSSVRKYLGGPGAAPPALP